MYGWHAKTYANKAGMMQCISKAPHLHLFHTTVGQHPWELLLNLQQPMLIQKMY